MQKAPAFLRAATGLGRGKNEAQRGKGKGASVNYVYIYTRKDFKKNSPGKSNHETCL
jgi:hypothetical protein